MNPYPHGSELAAIWQLGYDEAASASGRTYDDHPASDRSAAYDEGRTAGESMILDPIRCKCNPPGPGPVGVALDGNGRTTVCRECNGRGWLKPEPQVFVCRQSDVREDQA